MGRRKLERNPTLDKANARQAGIKSIDPKLDLGKGLTMDNYTAQIKATSDSVNDYNTTLSTVDEKYNRFKAEVAKLRDWNERMLSGVGSAYGKDSSEYEKAGGVRKSEKKKPKRKSNK